MTTALMTFIEKQTEKDKEFSFATWFKDINFEKEKVLWISVSPYQFNQFDENCSSYWIGDLEKNQNETRMDIFGYRKNFTLSQFLSIVLSDNKPVFEHIKNNTPTIQQFFSEFLFFKSKNKEKDFEKLRKKILSIQMFADWFIEKISVNPKLYFSTHPCKFSHPSAETTPIIAESKDNPYGYLTGTSIHSQLDVFGNGALISLSRFLAIVLSDNQTVFEHIQAGSPLIQAFFKAQNLDFADIQEKVLAIPKTIKTKQTDQFVKQVYFPIGNGEYHLLSLLTPSGLIAQLKQHIDEMKFSQETKNAKECRRENKYHETGFSEIYSLAVMVYGGNHPHNITAINRDITKTEKKGNKSIHTGPYLLPSMPPDFLQRKVRLPKNDFFTQSIYPKMFASQIKELTRLFKADVNNKKIRQGIENIMKYWVNEILFEAYKIRQYQIAWTQSEYYQELTLTQKIWLDDFYQEKRDDEWLNNISEEIARYVINTYLSTNERQLVLGDTELLWLKQLTLEQAKSSLQKGKM